MKKIIKFIENYSIFSGINSDDILLMLDCIEAEKKTFSKKSCIISSGMSVNALGLLVSGSAIASQDDFWGNRNIMAKIMPGQMFGESFACSENSIANVDVIAQEECCVLWLNVQKIMYVCPSACGFHNKLVQNLLYALAEKNLYFNQKISFMSKRSTKEKLLSYLSAQAFENGSSEFDIHFSRQQLADYLSVERSAMSAQLSQLKKDKIIDYHKNHFVLMQTDI